MLSAACFVWAPMFCKRYISLSTVMPTVLNLFLALYIVNRCLCIWHK